MEQVAGQKFADRKLVVDWVAGSSPAIERAAMEGEREREGEGEHAEKRVWKMSRCKSQFTPLISFFFNVIKRKF